MENIVKTPLDAIGLNPTHTERLVNNLQRLLADYSIFYQNVRGFHWNVTGPRFFELHAKFEELYEDLNAKIDEIAERIRILSGKPNHKFSSYLEVADLAEADAESDEDQVRMVLQGLSTLIKIQREVFCIAQDAEDEGTATMLSENIVSQEKLVWMYSALLKY